MAATFASKLVPITATRCRSPEPGRRSVRPAAGGPHGISPAVIRLVAPVGNGLLAAHNARKDVTILERNRRIYV